MRQKNGGRKISDCKDHKIFTEGNEGNEEQGGADLQLGKRDHGSAFVRLRRDEWTRINSEGLRQKDGGRKMGAVIMLDRKSLVSFRNGMVDGPLPAAFRVRNSVKAHWPVNVSDVLESFR